MTDQINRLEARNLTADEMKKVARIATIAGYYTEAIWDELCAAFPEHASTIDAERRDCGFEERFEAAREAWGDAGYPAGQEPKVWTIE